MKIRISSPFAIQIVTVALAGAMLSFVREEKSFPEPALRIILGNGSPLLIEEQLAPARP